MAGMAAAGDSDRGCYLPAQISGRGLELGSEWVDEADNSGRRPRARKQIGLRSEISLHTLASRVLEQTAAGRYRGVLFTQRWNAPGQASHGRAGGYHRSSEQRGFSQWPEAELRNSQRASLRS